MEKNKRYEYILDNIEHDKVYCHIHISNVEGIWRLF